MIYNQKNINYLIIISFLISSILSFYYLNKYDDYSKYKNQKHPMIKTAVQNNWKEANSIIKDFKAGKNFMESGGPHFDEFLPPKIIAIFYLLIGEDIYEDELIKIKNGKLLLIYLKTFFYFFSLFFLSTIISKKFSLRHSFYTIFFLSLLPDIFQYHSSFWNEAFFFIFQIMLIYFILKQSSNVRDNIFLGIFLAAMYLTSQEYLLFFLVVIVYLILEFKKNFKPLIFFISSFLTILLFVNITNQKIENQTSNFGIKSAPYLYLAPKIISKKNGLSINESKIILKNNSIKWSKENDLEIKNSNSYYLKFKNYEDENKFMNYVFLESIKIMSSSPIISLKLILESTLHLGTLNPFYINYFYKYNGTGEFLKTDTHQKLIPVRIFYSIIIYSIIVLGFFKSLKNNNLSIIMFFSLSVLYVIATMGWMGFPRYFVPALIFMSFFFGNSFEGKESKAS